MKECRWIQRDIKRTKNEMQSDRKHFKGVQLESLLEYEKYSGQFHLTVSMMTLYVSELKHII